MRVVVDARTLHAPAPGGVARYVRGLLEHVPDAVDVSAVVAAELPGRTPADVPTVALGGSRLPNLAWLELRCGPWLRRERPDVFVAPFYAAPLRCAVPVALGIHDLAPFVHPVDFGIAKRTLWRAWMRRSVRQAGLVLTGSEWVRGQIVERFEGVCVVVAEPGADERFTPSNRALVGDVAARLGLPARYVIAFGGAPRRNLPLAVAAWRRARRPAPDVALVVLNAAETEPEPGLVVLPRISDDDLAVVVAGADALLYPTTHEGYGLPAREALDSGVPVVCSRVGSLPEILGDAAVWCGERPEPTAYGDALVELLTDDGRRAEVVARSLDRSRQLPGPAQAAAQVWTAVQRMEQVRG